MVLDSISQENRRKEMLNQRSHSLVPMKSSLIFALLVRLRGGSPKSTTNRELGGRWSLIRGMKKGWLRDLQRMPSMSLVRRTWKFKHYSLHGPFSYFRAKNKYYALRVSGTAETGVFIRCYTLFTVCCLGITYYSTIQCFLNHGKSMKTSRSLER